MITNQVDDEEEPAPIHQEDTPIKADSQYFSKKVGVVVSPIIQFGSPDSDRDVFDAVVPERQSQKKTFSEKKVVYHARFLDDTVLKDEGEDTKEGKHDDREDPESESDDEKEEEEQAPLEPNEQKVNDDNEKGITQSQKRQSERLTKLPSNNDEVHGDPVEEDHQYDNEEILKPSDEVDDYYDYDDDLPNGWTKYYDENYQTYYYMNNLTGETQWEFPTTAATDSTLPSKENSPIRTVSKLVIDEGLENLKKFNEKNKKRAKSLSSVSIEWFGSEDFHDYMSDAISSPLARRHSEVYNPNMNASSPSSPAPPSPSRNHFLEYRGTCNLDRKSSSLAAAGKTIGKLNQDYVQMARLYKIQRPYSDPNYAALCLICHKNYAEDVFFPCEHHCVCRKCIFKENICEERQLLKIPDGYINCSLCASIIKLILPLDGGKEVEKYWNWVYEEKVTLPPSFMRNFKHSAAVIQAVYIEDNQHGHHPRSRSSNTTSTFCTIN